MRKLKIKTKSLILQPTNMEIIMYIYCKITNIFALMFDDPSVALIEYYSNKKSNNTNRIDKNSKRLEIYTKSCESDDDIILFNHGGIELFDYYNIGYLMKLFYNLDIQKSIKEIDYNQYIKKDFNPIIKTSYMEYEKNKMMFYNYFKNDSKLSKCIFNLFFELTTNIRLFDYMYDKFNITRDDKTINFINSYKNFANKFINDLTQCENYKEVINER